MGRKFRLTEEQVNMLKESGVTLTADLSAANGDVSKAVETTKQEASQSGIDPKKVNIQIPATENKIITKKSIYENRLNALKKTSTVYSLKDFFKEIKK